MGNPLPRLFGRSRYHPRPRIVSVSTAKTRPTQTTREQESEDDKGVHGGHVKNLVVILDSVAEALLSGDKLQGDYPYDSIDHGQLDSGQDVRPCRGQQDLPEYLSGRTLQALADVDSNFRSRLKAEVGIEADRNCCHHRGEYDNRPVIEAKHDEKKRIENHQRNGVTRG